MPKEFHIFTVGASLLRNLARDQRFSEYGISRILAGEKALQGLLDAAVEELSSRPRELSAELNAFYGFQSIAAPPPPGEVGIKLYSTDTEAGWFCASAIYRHLSERGYAVEEPVRVPRLSSEPAVFEEGLVNLLDVLATDIPRMKSRNCLVYLNATGGFKPEAAFAVMTAFFFGADLAYYVHESFREVVILYPLPLSLNSDFLKAVMALDGATPDSAGLPLVFESGVSRLVLNLDDLIRRGLIREEGGVIRARSWVKKLAEHVKRLA